ncbi:MAG: exodeoxyribonuclease VII small subunit [Bacteroidota bacterium]
MQKNNSKQTFEDAMMRLEAIVEALEKGEIALDESLALYEEGVELSKQCMEKLSKAEIKLKRITKTIDGTFEMFNMQSEESEEK